ncbi:MAG: DUF4932 domain-containing protein [Planctomycetes bacterium]|nr:DUF4932 domain-containing protein [Planctomycetota bacterium]
MLILLLAFFQSGPAAGTPQTPGTLAVRVDPRVELLSIVFRLAGNPEYNMENSKSPYAQAVEEHFGKFRDHAAVKMAQALRRSNGVSYDAVMSLAIHLEDAFEPAPRTPLDPLPDLLDRRWTKEDAERFIAALRDFVRDADFKGFAASQRERYEKSAAKLAAVVRKRDFVGWFSDFFGDRPRGSFQVAVGMLNGGGNYGVNMRHHDGREEISPIIGIYKWDAEGLPAIGDEVTDTIVHEFCHTYTNACINKHLDKLDAAGDVLFARNAAAMKRQAYGNGATVLRESLVRACVIHYMRTVVSADAGRKQALSEMTRGFKWTPGLADLLGEFAKSRDKYKTLDDFMPRIIEYFDHITKQYDELLARFPKVKSISPANAAPDVDPKTAEVVITFDRPMQAGGWALTGGGPELPKFGKPSYNDSRTVLTVPVTLEPGRSYRFGLNGGRFYSFVSEDGYPLEPVEVKFTTAK